MDKREMLGAIAHHYGLDRNADFARFFGITEQSAFQQRKNGVIKYEEIYRRCPEISPDWLLSGGEGQMLRKDKVENRGNISVGATTSTQTFNASDGTAEKALEALAKEQEALARAQDQISGLIDLLHRQ